MADLYAGKRRGPIWTARKQLWQAAAKKGRLPKTLIQKNKFGNRMPVYEIKVHERKVDVLLGTAFPSRRLDIAGRKRFLLTLISDTFGIEIRDPMTGTIGDSNVAVELNGDIYTVHFQHRSNKGYNIALQIEEYFDHVKPQSFIKMPQFVYSLFYGRTPSDTFCLDGVDFEDVLFWLSEQVSSSDYQIYSKFGNDTSISFRNPEHAALYKLTFGDNT